jgi:hypothetical protein
MKNYLLIAIMALLVSSCGMIKGTSRTAPSYYFADIDGYGMIFKDGLEKVENARRTQSITGVKDITVKKIIKGKNEIWEVTNKLDDLLLSVHIDKMVRIEELKDANIVSIPLNMIVDYTRAVK